MTTRLEQFKQKLISPIPPTQAKWFIENLWTYDLEVTPEEIWPVLSDTSKMNRDMGLSVWHELVIKGETHGEATTLWRLQKWIEKPWIWVQGKELQNHRLFSQGWMKEQRGVFTVEPTSQGCRIYIYFRWTFTSLFSKLVLQATSPILKNSFKKFFEDKERIIKNSGKVQDILSLQNISVETEEQVKAKLQELKNELSDQWSSTLEAFAQYLLTQDEMDMDRVHLKKVSNDLGIDLKELFVASAAMIKKGYLSLTWDIICPHCRGATSSESRLNSITEKNECEACKVDFNLDPEESIEIVFHLSEKLRPIRKLIYCAAEPAKKKHIKLMQIIKPKEKKKFQLNLSAGRYRAIVHQSDEVQNFEIKENQSNFEYQFENNLNEEVYLSIEEAWWFRDRLFPGEVLSSPILREFFSEDHLQVGVKINVGHQVLLFTDIVGSTPLYKDSGDAKAFRYVQSHYKEVADAINESNGVVVKFIGDAVMAAFLDLNSAFQAALDIHKRFSGNRKDTPLLLRISLHHGQILCANMNVGLDYFGSTVNNAAKIQKWANEHQIAMVSDVWELLKPKFENQIAKFERQDDGKLGLNVAILTVKK